MSDLERSVRGWQQGDGEAFWQLTVELWAEFRPAACALCRRPGIDHDRVEERAWKAFLEAMEEMDLRGGKLLAEPTGKTREVKQKDGKTVPKPVFKVKVSGRELPGRERFEWRGDRAFRALFGRILSFRCLAAPRGDRMYYIPLGPTWTPEEGEQGYEPEGEMPDAEELLLQRDQVLALIEALAQAAEQLYSRRKKALAELLEGLCLYVKWEVWKAGPIEPPLDDRMDQLQGQTIEELWDRSRAQCLDFDEEEAWSFVLTLLRIEQDPLYLRKHRLFVWLLRLPGAPDASRMMAFWLVERKKWRDVLYKRKSLLFATLRELPETPDVLRGMAGRFWLGEMNRWARDSAVTADRLRQQGDRDGAEALRVVEFYLKWTFAQGHPVLRSWSEGQVRAEAPERLFRVNNPALLVPAYPAADHFGQFLGRHARRCTSARLPGLRTALEELRPRPIRLVTLIDLLCKDEEA